MTDLDNHETAYRRASLADISQLEGPPRRIIQTASSGQVMPDRKQQPAAGPILPRQPRWPGFSLFSPGCRDPLADIMSDAILDERTRYGARK